MAVKKKEFMTTRACPEFKARLQDVADKERRPLSQIILMILEEYMEKYMEKNK